MAMRTLDWMPSTSENIGSWKERHWAAVTSARIITDTAEASIVLALMAWNNYATAYQQRFDAKIGENYMHGPAWARWGFAIRELLTGETGRLDAGTLDSIICHNLIEQGFNPS